MKESFLILVLVVFSSSAFSLGQKSIVYKVVGILKTQSLSEWTQLKTLSNSQVNVNCKAAAFDDSVRDRVGGFKTSKDCQDFLKDVVKHASTLTPVDVEIADDFIIKYTVNI